MSGVEISKVVKAFPIPGTAPRIVLNEVSFVIPSGSVAALVGPNGCGKTTVLSAIAGMGPPDRGKVLVEGKSPTEAHIGFMWQNYRASLLPWLSVSENIAFPLRLRGMPLAERKQAVATLVTEAGVNLPLSQKIYRLSGGQQQLTCLMRALITNPDVLLLDEPTSALDLQAKWNLFEQVERQRERRNLTTIWVSHDPDEAVLAADMILLMSPEGGKIVDIVRNELPRPRSLEMLSDAEHLRCRKEVLDFILRKTSLNGV